LAKKGQRGAGELLRTTRGVKAIVTDSFLVPSTFRCAIDCPASAGDYPESTIFMLHNLLTRLFPARKTRRLRKPARRPSVLGHYHLEQLEDRRLLAAVATDLLDYAPGSTAYFSASGFVAGEAVTFQVAHATDGATDAPWTVIDDSAEDADPAAGSVRTSWYVDPAFAAGQTLIVTATGELGDTASAMFTDSAGSIQTTDSTGQTVNQNMFPSKDAVYLQGGPNNDNAASGLPDGDYYVWVTAPGNAANDPDKLLGFSKTPTVHVHDGTFDQVYKLVDLVYSESSGETVKGFDDTTNNGGEYTVYAQKDNPADNFDHSGAKTDNFKVLESTVTNIELSGQKFYDANRNGINDLTEPKLPGWTIILDDGGTPGQLDSGETYAVTDDNGNWVINNVAPGPHTLTEVLPAGWTQTVGDTQITAMSGQNIADLDFGNYNAGESTGLTIGYWSNKNGAKDLARLNWSSTSSSPVQDTLNDLHLRNADGSFYDPRNKTIAQFQGWLLSATATNMANMLSAQLAATQLNICKGITSADEYVYVGTDGSGNPLDNLANPLSRNSQGTALSSNLSSLDDGSHLIKIQEAINAAATLLATDGIITTTTNANDRAYAEALKIIFDSLNNNQIWVYDLL
jgi:hypothetical protein